VIDGFIREILDINDQNETIFITDRLKEIIKYHRIPVSPLEIEQILLTHEPVAEVAVVRIEHESDNL
jgi:acyl-CoA synthetase (AMP-forming)/AMP-acid ligase II